MNRVNIMLKRKPYLVNIKLGYDVVKECVQIIEQFHNLMRIIVVILMELDLVFGVGCNDGKGKGRFYLKCCAR